MRIATAAAVCLLTTFCNASDPAQPTPPSHSSTPGHSIQQLIELTPPDGGEDGFFGQSVVIGGDTIAVESFSNNIGQGKIYVYTKPATGWQDATLTAELTVEGFSGFMGSPLVISPDGNTIVVNGTFDLNMPDSPVFVYVKPAGGWVNMTQTAALHATGGGVWNFGWSIATDGDNILVGGLGCSGDGDFSPGAAYLFVKPAGGWTNMAQTGALEETDAIGCDDYGSTVAIQGNTAVVGRSGGGMTPPVAPGSLYVFTKPATGWQGMRQTAKLSAQPDYLYSGLGGLNIALSGNTILALVDLQSSPGSAAYIYTEPSGGWQAASENASLTDANSKVKTLRTGAAFDGSTAAIIANYGNTFGIGGLRSLTVYNEPANGWQDVATPSAVFMPSDETVNDGFGERAVAVSGNIIVVGSEAATRNGVSREGAVYIFQEN